MTRFAVRAERSSRIRVEFAFPVSVLQEVPRNEDLVSESDGGRVRGRAPVGDALPDRARSDRGGRRNDVREPERAQASQHHHHGGAGRGAWRLHAAGRGAGRGGARRGRTRRASADGRWRQAVGRAAGPRAGLRQPPVVLSRRGDAHAVERLGHQGRSVAARRRMERQVSGGRQRRMGRHDLVPRAGASRRRRLRHREHGYRSHRQFRRVRAGPSREAGRFRLPRRSRNDRAGQGHRRRLLRHGAHGRRSGTAARSAGGRGSRKRSATPPTSTRLSPARRPSTRCACTACGWR